MLVELAIGDAWGVGFEYASEMIKYNNLSLSRYIQHPRHKGLHPGMYSDDTAMSIAIAELILSGDELTSFNIAIILVDCYKSLPRDCCTPGFKIILKSISKYLESLKRIHHCSD